MKYILYRDRNNIDEGEDEQEQFIIPSLNDALGAVTILQKFLTFNDEFHSVNSQNVLRQMP